MWRIALALVAPLTACNTYFHGDGGYLRPASDRPGHEGAAFGLHVGAHSSKHADHVVGGGIALRVKLAPDLQQVAISEEMIAIPFHKSPVAPFLRGGLNIFQFESVDRGFGFGMFGPYGEAGVIINLRTREDGVRYFITLTAFAEYDPRFTSQDGAGYFGLQVGFGQRGTPSAVPVAHDYLD